MKGYSNKLLALALSAVTLLTPLTAHAHTGNQVNDTLQSLTGHRPERPQPRQREANLAADQWRSIQARLNQDQGAPPQPVNIVTD